MENKKTTELLDLIGAVSVDERNDKSISDKRIDEYVEAMSELRQRQPFSMIFGTDDIDEDSSSIAVRVVEVQAELKEFKGKIRRHKHDPTNGDVMIRI